MSAFGLTHPVNSCSRVEVIRLSAATIRLSRLYPKRLAGLVLESLEDRGNRMLEKLSHWIQIVSGVVLIVGVVLVVIQLQQNERLAQAQLASEWFTQRAAQAGTAAGEKPMHAFAKLCNPDALLSEEDALVLHALFLQRLYMGTYARVVSPLVGLSDGATWQQFAQANTGFVVATPQGRAWAEWVIRDDEVRDAVLASPLADWDCSEGKVVGSALLRADRELKAKMSE